MNTKRCSKCGEEKPLDNFTRCRNGLSSWCRACKTKQSVESTRATRKLAIAHAKAMRTDRYEDVAALHSGGFSISQIAARLQIKDSEVRRNVIYFMRFGYLDEIAAAS